MPKKIAVIGGGFAGTMVIRQLIDQGFKGEITRFHHSDSETLGPAYRADSGDLLLNVRSQNMSAFPDDSNILIQVHLLHVPFTDII
ncbi:MAG: FAD-NAD(P)-binding [Bacteroidota bacterium]